MNNRWFLVAAVPLLGLSHIASAQITLTDTVHNSDAGGVWNNSNAANWAIWYDQESNPANVSRPFVNEPNPLTQDIVIPEGTTTYTLVKNSYNTTDVSNVFSFSNGVQTGTITIPGAGAYQTTNGPVPAQTASTTIGNTTVTITQFGWYNPSVFNVNLVGPNQNLPPADIGGPDDVGLVTFQVSTIPEPSALFGVLGTGALALLLRRRRSR